MLKKIKCIFVYVLSISFVLNCVLILPASAAVARIDTIWIETRDEEVVTVNLDILKTKDISYGFEFTSPKDINNPTDFSSGKYTANGMFRLTAGDEMIFRKENGAWISEAQESDNNLVRVPFSKNKWHNVRVVFNRTQMTAQWFLDDTELGTTTMKSGDVPVNGVSMFADELVSDGIEWALSTELSVDVKNAAILETNTHSFSTSQGNNNWYYCHFGNHQIYEMLLNGQGEWQGITDPPKITSENVNPSNDGQVGYKFVCPRNGTVRVRGVVNMPYPDCEQGDGVIATIYKDEKMQWIKPVTYGVDAEYDMAFSVKKGEAISFRIECNSNNIFDRTAWTPSVEYIDLDYVPETENYNYYQNINGQIVPLQYDNEKQAYVCSDGVGYIDSHNVYLTGDNVLRRSYTIPQDGRYRIYGTLKAEDKGGGTVITVYKNSEKIWKQMIPDGKIGNLDIGLPTNRNDVIKVEVSKAESGADKHVSFHYETKKYLGTLFCGASTAQGNSYRTDDTFTLSSLIGTTQGENGVQIYSVSRDVKYPMTYNSANARWESTVEGSGGFVSKTQAFSGLYTDSVIEYTVSKSGIIKIDGDMSVSDIGDGVISKICLNDKEIWSSRTGGERAVRWDEEFDTSYFLNHASVEAYVKEGDRLIFVFNQWRKTDYDTVNFKNINISYIKGDLLSDTTKWKLKESTVIDTEDGKLYKNGNKTDINVVKDGDTVYVDKNDYPEIFDTEAIGSDLYVGDTEYVSLNDKAVENDKNTEFVADRLMIMYDGIPVMFGYSELSELDTVLSVEADKAAIIDISLINSSGVLVTSLLKGREYYLKAQIDNYIGGDMDLQFLIAQYDSDMRLVDVSVPNKMLLPYGTTFTLDKTSAEAVSFTVNKSAKNLKVFVWNSLEDMNSYINALPYTVR